MSAEQMLVRPEVEGLKLDALPGLLDEVRAFLRQFSHHHACSVHLTEMLDCDCQIGRIRKAMSALVGGGRIPSVLDPIELSVRDERARQDSKWGEQNHPNGTGGRYWESRANAAKARCGMNAQAGTITYLDILAEEVYEGFAESDPEKLKVELIQIAAVCKQWVEAIERRARRSL